jgi:hypothetical protein
MRYVGQPMSARGQKPALPRRSIGVRFALNKQTLTERVQCDAMCHKPTYAVQQRKLYSITSSARASSVGGTSRPSAFATIRLTTRSNLVGCSTGRSAGFAPRKILSTKSPARR